MLKLYNTLSKKKEEFVPLVPGQVKMYTCGPTVYNYYHIGNLRNAVFNDTVRRTLEASGLTVQHVMNITDVGHLVSDADEGEDKLEKGATREGKTVWEVATFYANAFKHDMQAMDVLPPTVDPKKTKNKEEQDPYARATDFIPEQIEMVRILLEQGYAYQTQQAIYFEVAKLADYGLLTGQKLSEKEVAVRTEIVTDPEKRSPHDFSLWFFTVGHFADHTMKWASPWGEGFPGWHLECSAIIHALLGDPIDIHTGGVDHIGTHHPNEIAQTEAAFGHPLAKFWLHNEFILVDGQKMAKSLGNSYMLKDVLDRGYSSMDLRMLYLGVHYRTQMNFTWESLKQAKKNKETLLNTYERLKNSPGESGYDGSTQMNKIKLAVTDDLNTPLALSEALTLGREINTALDQAQAINQRALLEAFNTLFNLFGLHEETVDIPEEVHILVAQREQARKAKDFTLADTLRNKIEQLGFIVEDTSTGQKVKKL